ncbi:MAG: type I polyketide synthase, partial [Acidobacteriaceae bacterium]|nr:type I polyketide synthase [Acidobacteriaceae bacterium]
MEPKPNSVLDGIAVIGMAGRFPGAANPSEFWQNLKNGVESITRFSSEELEVRDSAELRQANYVRARAILDGIDQFDPDFFGIYPQEARLMDPQHRVFLECCWEAIEDAGYDVTSIAQPVGVFAGCSPNSYFLTQVCQDREFALDYAASYQVGHYTTMLGAIADTLATRVAYKLNLRGPAVTLLSACSTSLVAVCQACTSLLTYQCDYALSGGVSITLPQKRGYLYQAGGMVSPDGHCRAFDEGAQGTVFGSGAGVVFLKRLADAVADRDPIYAVIRGFATNNDGSSKVGFTAPSIEGQASAIAAAQALAGVAADSISYIEAHGTGTPLGDPIEVAALTQVFRASTARTGFCALGTAKGNVGHLDVAAGVTGLIKTALALKHRQIPPMLHFRTPNPKLKLESSPFYVNSELLDWQPTSSNPRRAGVSAFGVGGTNAHLVLEDGPPRESTPGKRPVHLLPLSARSADALLGTAERLASKLAGDPDAALADVAYTLQTGRRAHDFRGAVVAKDAGEAAHLLKAQNRSFARRVFERPAVHFLFPGQGAQYVNMGRDLYRLEPQFQRSLDQCAEILLPVLGQDIRTVLYATGQPSAAAAERLNQTQFAQPALFSIEYALAQLWMSWGIHPAGMIGHSVGEFVCACLAGVFSLEDALTLVARRGILMQHLPGGSMLSVRLPEADVLPLLNGDLSLAAINAPSLSVVSGPSHKIRALEDTLSARRIACRQLHTSHAFHSAMMDPILEAFGQAFRTVSLRPPQLPYLSCVTGEWIREEQAIDPGYWARHFRLPVRFSDAVSRLCADASNVLLEVGPGNALQTLARQQPAFAKASHIAVSSLPDARAREQKGDHATLFEALGTLWTSGIHPDWKALYTDEKRLRISLP